ncbi:MAG TPA: hypothetical protein VGI43_13015 [Mucilaginibacter sp.]|jgi:hypothetical protein
MQDVLQASRPSCGVLKRVQHDIVFLKVISLERFYAAGDKTAYKFVGKTVEIDKKTHTFNCLFN